MNNGSAAQTSTGFTPQAQSARTTGMIPTAKQGMHERIRLRAECIWEQLGRRDGRDLQHWQAAEHEVAREMDRGNCQTQVIRMKVLSKSTVHTYEESYDKSDDPTSVYWLRLDVKVVEGPELWRSVTTIDGLCVYAYKTHLQDGPNEDDVHYRSNRHLQELISVQDDLLVRVEDPPRPRRGRDGSVHIDYPASLGPKDVLGVINLTTNESLTGLFV